MGVLSIFGLIIISIIIFDKMKQMRKEIDAQWSSILTLLKRIKQLEATVDEMGENASAAKFAENTQVEKVEYKSVSKEEIVSEIVPFENNTEKERILTSEFTQEKVSPFIAVEQEKAKETVLIKPLFDFAQPPAPVKKRQVNKVEKKPLIRFNSENWVGVNLLNRLGALLIVIGAIATAAFDGFPSWIRSLILFTFAISVLILGEVMNRKKSTTASIGVTAVGVALVYVAVAASFFVLGTLGMYAALVACIIATALGIYLAIRYDEQVVACFALVGGYLPIFALDPFNDTLTIGLVVYFVLLSTYSLSLALAKKWSISNFIGLFLTVLGTTYLGFQARPLVALIYSCFAFMVYTIMPLLSAYKTNKTFNQADTWLVIINAFISSIIVFLIATRLDVPYIHTYLSIIFALTYIILSQLIKKVFQHKSMTLLFLLKAIAFAFLFVPFTFNYQWFAIAWLIEAVVLMSYGIMRKHKISEYSGLAILGIAVLSFFVNTVISFDSQFTLDYSFFSIGILVILGVFVYRGRQWGGYGRIFKWAALCNFWLYFIYLWASYTATVGYMRIFAAVGCLVLAFLYVKLKFLADKGTHLIANVVHAFALILLWQSNFEAGDAVWFAFVDHGVLFVNMVVMLLAVCLVVYYRLTEKPTFWAIFYKNVNLIVFWLALLWSVSNLIPLDLLFDHEHYFLSILAVVTLVLAVVYVKLKLLVDNGLRVIVNVMHGIAVLMLWSSNFYLSDLNWQQESQFLLFIFNLVVNFILVGLVVYYLKKMSDHSWVVAYKNISLVSLWLMIVFVVIECLLVVNVLNGNYILLVIAILTLVLCAVYVKFKVLADRSLHVIVNVMHALAMLTLWVSNFIFAWWGFLNRGGLVLNLVITVVAFAFVVYDKMTRENSKRLVIYKNVMFVNLWLMMLFVFGGLMRYFEGAQLVLIIVTLMMALVVSRLPFLLDRGAKVILVVMQIGGLLWLATFNLSLYEAMFALLSLNAVAQLMALVTLNELVKLLRNREGKETPFKVLILSGYFLLVLTQGIMVQGQVAFSSALISVLFGVTALAWIILGFYLKNTHVRKFGLYLAMVSAVKLLVVDTWGLSTPMRIGSYLTLGVVLMIISFVYQKFKIEE